MLYPEAVTASLIASAKQIHFQGNQWSNRAGAGCVNYTKAREAVGNCIVFSNRNNNPGIIDTEIFSTVPNERIIISAFWLANIGAVNRNDFEHEKPTQIIT